MTTKENHALDYLYFRFPSNHALIFGPILIATTMVVFSIKLSTISTNFWIEVYNNQYSHIEDFLIYFKLTFVIFSSFFISYRWALYKKDGNLGYWLTQGVKRKNFFIISYLNFVFNAFIGIYFGLITIIFVYGVSIPNSLLFRLIILLFFSYSVLISVTILIGELVKDPEIALLTSISVYSIIYMVRDIFIGSKVFYPELEYNSAEYLVWIGISAIGGAVIWVIAFLLYLRRDLEL
ncbi:MAG: hypothetical protein GPJ54_21530 [Candidatus Heimdallarchaeota archaeon]|nr:hypothetical protein [Candidatus Heimdallarchaeota archaeon]